MKTVSHFALMIAAAACAPALASSHSAATAQPQAKKTAPKPAQAKRETQARAGAAASAAAAAPVPDLAGMQPVAYDCDMGDRLTVFRKPGDDQQIALQWNRQTHQLSRKETSTGAERFESEHSGWVWIGIPAKGMLLDSKKGRQLANECRNEEQKQLVQK